MRFLVFFCAVITGDKLSKGEKYNTYLSLSFFLYVSKFNTRKGISRIFTTDYFP
ncbi:hypothetical protein FM107_04445 [Sphingobacterium sp. JB170]|nr:hypothetical protein FM107_04445 [Sphingobacterium sp. JB170]